MGATSHHALHRSKSSIFLILLWLTQEDAPDAELHLYFGLGCRHLLSFRDGNTNW